MDDPDMGDPGILVEQVHQEASTDGNEAYFN
jgi:hypothetical protein